MGFDFVGAKFNTNKPQKEQIIKENPYIFIAGGPFQNENIRKLKEDETYKNLDAVKNNRVYNIPLAIVAFEQLSVFSVAFVQYQANILRPDLFKFNVKSTIREISEKLFNKSIDYVLMDKILKGEQYI